MAEFFETRMGMRFYEADVPRALKALERIASALEKLEAPKQKPEDEPRVRVAIYSNDPNAYGDLVDAPEGVVVSYEYHKNPTPEPEKKCGENICCDEPDCAERENKAEAKSIAKQIYAKDGEIEFDDDAKVSLSLDDEGDVQGAYVQAWVYVEFTANQKKGEG